MGDDVFSSDLAIFPSDFVALLVRAGRRICGVELVPGVNKGGIVTQVAGP